MNAAEGDSETRNHQACECSAASVALGLQSLFPERDPSLSLQFTKGFFFVWLAGGG
jgi:hypothetical protein